MTLAQLRLGSEVFVLTIKLGHSLVAAFCMFVLCFAVFALARINVVARNTTHLNESATVTKLSRLTD